jgi:hypothetical protein
LALTAAACDLGPPITPSTAMLDAPTGPGDRETQRRDVAERTARRDFACEDAKVVVALFLSETEGHPWQPLIQNTSGRPRYVVEGCGKRGLYVESCAFADDSMPKGDDTTPGSVPRVYECRYLLVSVVPMGAPTQASVAPAATDSAGDAGAPSATSM